MLTSWLLNNRHLFVDSEMDIRIDRIFFWWHISRFLIKKRTKRWDTSPLQE